MKKVLIILGVWIGLHEVATADTKDDLYKYVLKVLKEGSNKYGMSSGPMPPMMAIGKDAKDLARYVADGLKGNQPAAFAVCTSCHGEDGKGMGGFAPDLTNLSKNYSSGNEVKDFEDGVKAYKAKDYKTAATLFQKAADQGYAEAQFSLGMLYENGWGVKESDKKAAELYQKAADQGYAEAQFSLGMLYENGSGIEQSDTKAKELYRKACDSGFEFACKTTPSGF